MTYRVSLTKSAERDLNHFDVHDRRIIVAGILTHLKVGAEVRTRKKKLLQPNPVSPWELRIDRFRVFYSVGENNEVKVVAVGHKEHNVLFIRGKKIEL